MFKHMNRKKYFIGLSLVLLNSILYLTRKKHKSSKNISSRNINHKIINSQINEIEKKMRDDNMSLESIIDILNKINAISKNILSRSEISEKETETLLMIKNITEPSNDSY